MQKGQLASIGGVERDWRKTQASVLTPEMGSETERNLRKYYGNVVPS